MPPKPKPTRAPRKSRRRKPSERRLLEKQLWDLTSLYVRLRDEQCVTCGATEGLTMSHWIKAGKQRVRYDLRNVNCQCKTCNGRHNHWTVYYDNYMLYHYSQETLIQLTEWGREKAWKWSVLSLRDMVCDRYYALSGLLKDKPNRDFENKKADIAARNDTWRRNA